MHKRETVIAALEGKKVPYTPWSIRFTVEAHDKLVEHYGTEDIPTAVDNHFVERLLDKK